MFGMQLLGIVLAVTGLFMLLRPWWQSSPSHTGGPIILADIVLLRHRILSGTVGLILGTVFIVIGLQGIVAHILPDALNLLSNGLIIVGILTIIMGLLFLLRPLALVRMSTLLDQWLGHEAFYARRPALWGSLFLASGFLLLGFSLIV
jgi:hypothetical protein